jgi:hypothetical protein
MTKRNQHPKTYIGFALALAITLAINSFNINAAAQGRPCRQGLKGVYVTWSKNSGAAGVGSFTPGAGLASVLPGFSWEVSGSPRAVTVASKEPFSGGNSMNGFYGSADGANNLNIRIDANNVNSGDIIPHSTLLTLRFDAVTPASGWGFAVVDMDVDQVRFRAKDALGNEVPAATLAKWFVQSFDANPSTDGVNVPSWDADEVAVVGSESGASKWRTTVEGGLTDSEAGAAWFQPQISLSELRLEYQSLQEGATPSYHVLIAACSTSYLTATPTPNTTGDSDQDTISDVSEGSGDPDNDDIPNYLDRDSDGDTILDYIEGNGDPDGDGIGNFLDSDSDGDDVPDSIERDPDAYGDPDSGIDSNRDGVDDGAEQRTQEGVDDSDRDTTPDYLDQDSDNDGKDDGDEAFDIDGDGSRDVTPLGADVNDNGLDDAFEAFDSADDVNSSFSGDPNEVVCQTVGIKRIKKGVEQRLASLSGRVANFSKRAAQCGATVPTGLVSDAALNRRRFEQQLRSTFPDRGLLCPESTCNLTSNRDAKVGLRTLASEIYRDAKRAKLLAISSCGVVEERPTVRRPTTETFLAQLRSEIAKLPNRLSRCAK